MVTRATHETIRVLLSKGRVFDPRRPLPDHYLLPGSSEGGSFLNAIILESLLLDLCEKCAKFSILH